MIEAQAWMSNYITIFNMDLVTYPSPYHDAGLPNIFSETDPTWLYYF